MFNTSSYLRWATFYTTALVLLAGWLLFEKMPDGREKLAGSIGNTLRGSRKAIAQINNKWLQAIQEEAADYPHPQNQDYANRATRALLLATEFEKQNEITSADMRISALKDSFLMLADNDGYSQKAAAGFFLTSGKKHFEKNKELRINELLVQAQALSAVVLTYCGTKVIGTDGWGIRKWRPAFLPNTFMPLPDEPFQAKILLTDYDSRCIDFSCWFNNQPVTLREGEGSIHTTFSAPGSHHLQLRFRREHCREGSVTEVSRDFQVNVLERCDSVPLR